MIIDKTYLTQSFSRIPKIQLHDKHSTLTIPRTGIGTPPTQGLSVTQPTVEIKNSE